MSHLKNKGALSYKKRIIFITGGARSGKSGFALEEASSCKGNKVYIATAQAFDEEMKERIEKHKKERSEGWDCIEEPLKIKDVLASKKYDVVLIDCLTLWLSNLMLTGKDIEVEILSLINALRITHHASRIYIVSNEVGMGIVPENDMARRFRDLAGRLNQNVAEIADEVYMTVSGIPVRIK